MITLVNLHGLASAKPNHIIEPSLAGHDSSSLIEASLQTNPTSDGYVAEANRPLLVLSNALNLSDISSSFYGYVR